MIDFTKYKLSNIRYGGSERKLGIIIDDNNYNWNNNNNEFVASFVPIKYGRNWL